MTSWIRLPWRATPAPPPPVCDEDRRALWLLGLGLVEVAGAPAATDGTVLAAGLANLWALGYVPDRALVEAWRSRSDAALSLARTHRLGLELLGGHRPMKPFYPGFPEQVAAASEGELLLNALLHYTGDLVGARILPVYDRVVRARLSDDAVQRTVRLATPDLVADAVRTLVGRSAGLAAGDVEMVGVWARTDPELLRAMLPERFANRENLAIVIAALVQVGEPVDDLSVQVATATDVLRLAAALCGGDASLVDPTRLRLSRSRRRLLLGLLEGLPVIDLWGRPERFKRLGEVLHPGEHADRYPRTAAAFADLRSGRRPPTLLTEVEAALAEGRPADAAQALALQRPGELGRRLDALLRRTPDDVPAVLAAFERCAEHLSTRVLLSVLGHFAHRGEASGGVRVFLPTGGSVQAVSRPDTRAALDPTTCADVVRVARSVLVGRFAALPPLGAVWVDPQADRLAVPMTLRNASPGVRTAGRGSRLPLEGAMDVQRAFLWWCDRAGERVDLDLSVVLLDDTMARSHDVAYYALRTRGCLHSGDLTSAPPPDGAVELVDLDLPVLREQGWRYAVLVVTSYSGQSFDRLDGVFAGLQGRSSGQAGEVFEPSRVSLRFDITSRSRVVVPLVVDLEAREMLWTDIGLAARPEVRIAADTNALSIVTLVQGMLDARPLTLTELFDLHVEARGHRARSAEEADLVIGPGGHVDLLDAGTVMTDWVVEP